MPTRLRGSSTAWATRFGVNQKRLATDRSPDRNEQFLYISDLRDRFQRRGLPIISVDTNYDPSRIMDIVPEPIRVHAVVTERQPHP